MSLSEEQGKILLRTAREAIIQVCKGNAPEPDKKLKDSFPDKQGIFVTLHKNGELRGCIGFPEPTYPLYDAIIRASVLAAMDDPRFPKVSLDEMDEIKIEISVLTVPEKIEVNDPAEYLSRIKVGRDGLIIRSSFNSGLLLPQVPVEWNWKIKDYLSHLCMKAGLPPDSWKEPGNEIYAFQAQIFSE